MVDSIPCAEEDETLATMRDVVLLTVVFLCTKIHVGNTMHLKHPTFIQLLLVGSYGVLQRENYISIYSVFVFKM